MVESFGVVGDRWRRPGTTRSLRLGDTTVSYVPDGELRLPPGVAFPQADARVWSEHPEYLDDFGLLVLSVGALLVERDGRALLIDAGFGPEELPLVPGVPHSTIRGGGLLAGLAALGRRPEEIEAVAVTHLHPDHLGWAWRPGPDGGRPVFAHAEHLVAEPEWAARDRGSEQAAEHGAAHGPAREIAGVAPYVRTVTDGQEVFPGVRARVTGGHTAGHTEYVIEDGGRRLIAFGDAMHAPVQVGHPGWFVGADHDPARAAAHRARLVEELAQPGVIGFGVHFADVVFGRVVSGQVDSGPVWCPVDA
ncbi:MBL fold metallo-hydrolase [Kitasatospora misakiensis]|uniref:MBL fold metallo-hydrolase n=1 Tax=Kitasatospora misakiensis TaxID=67330 RepID=A0ABW0WVH3_9ACTN